MTGKAARGRGGRRGGKAVVTAAVIVPVLALGSWYLYTGGYLDRLRGLDREAAAAPTPTLPAVTIEVTTQTLVETEEVEGTLGYGEEYQLSAGLQGVLTWIAPERSVVRHGEVLYRVSNRPIVLLKGKLPIYRPLVDGMENGPDVKQLEANLAAFGYSGFDVDNEFTENTTKAVKAWQADLGLTETGRVEPGQAVVQPGKVRIGSHLAQVGDRVAPNEPVLAYTEPRRRVTVALEVDDRELVAKGASVVVVLPDGQTVDGIIAEISAVAEAPATEESQSSGPVGTSSEEEPSTVEVLVTLDDPDQLGGFDEAPVDVQLTSEEREDVLVVPVSALLALREGGYGLEVVRDRSTELVAVKVGMFANGMVEVSGEGISEGVEVGVAE